MLNSVDEALKALSKKLKIIIFDLDGTLIDSFKAMHETYNHTLKKFNLPESGPHQTMLLIGTPLSKIFSDLLGQPRDSPEVKSCLETYRKKYIEICCQDSHLYDGVAEIIPELSKKYIIALATTKRTDVAEFTLDYFGLLKYFQMVLGADKVRNPKPSPEIINNILDEQSLKPSEAMMVGDSIYDLDAGSAAEVTTCIVTYGFGDKDSLRASNPDIIINQFNELRPLL